jgi:hypothetical protein
MVKYNIRSRQLVDVAGDLRRGKIILSPYFQRNLVWRQIHKEDFIKTILLGFPFPQIFIAKGGINIDDMSTTSVLVDGQQRMNSILEFINDKYNVEGKIFSNLTSSEKEEFLKYEIAIIELDMEANDPKIIEVFKRLNRTFYSLSAIEKLATEYAPSELMLIANLLANELDLKTAKDSELDPNIPFEFISWAKTKNVKDFNNLIIDSPIFSNYEISRKVHLMLVLNIIATLLDGFFNRNIKTKILDDYALNVINKDIVLDDLNKAAKFYNNLKLDSNSYWYNKSNFFSLIIVFTINIEFFSKQKGEDIKDKLEKFRIVLPSEYELAAKEGVNNKKERLLRNSYLEQILLS